MRVRLLQISKKNFGVETGICENDRLQVALQKFLRDSRRFVDVTAANTQRPIDYPRIVEDKGFLGGRCATGVEDCNLGFEQARGEFAGIRDGGGAANELWLSTVEARDTTQPAKDIRQMAAEHAAVSVQFVENDVPQIFEQPRPTRVVRKNSRVQHIRIRQDHVTFFANGFASVGRRVAVVCEDAETVIEPLVQVVEFLELILRERFCRKKVQRACVGVFQNCVQHRQVVAKRLAGSGGGDNHNI